MVQLSIFASSELAAIVKVIVLDPTMGENRGSDRLIEPVGGAVTRRKVELFTVAGANTLP
jgi:hypothetical protein